MLSPKLGVGGGEGGEMRNDAQIINPGNTRNTRTCAAGIEKVAHCNLIELLLQKGLEI